MTSARLLIAGIGNIFLGDDAFGVVVVDQLKQQPCPAGVEVRDFGIRGFDLACALQEGYEAVILVDAVRRGGPPGTLYVIEPATDPGPEAVAAPHLAMHSLDPVQVLALVRRMGGSLPYLLLVGCEPQTLEPAEDGFTLSEAVRAAVEPAAKLVWTLAAELLARVPEQEACR
jgi:hydrogenase maturation protease